MSRPLENPDPFDGLTYDEAVLLVIADQATSFKLRRRILEDADRIASATPRCCAPCKSFTWSDE